MVRVASFNQPIRQIIDCESLSDGRKIDFTRHCFYQSAGLAPEFNGVETRLLSSHDDEFWVWGIADLPLWPKPP